MLLNIFNVLLIIIYGQIKILYTIIIHFMEIIIINKNMRIIFIIYFLLYVMDYNE